MQIIWKYIDIDGLEGMKLIFGIIAVEGKANQEKDAKVIKLQINYF